MRFVALICVVGLLLNGCDSANPAPPTPDALTTPLPSPTPVQFGSIAPTPATEATRGTAPPVAEGVVTVAPETELAAIQTYLVNKMVALQKATSELRATGDRYYARVGTPPDYARLWQTDRADLIALVHEGQTRWLAASSLYEQAEGIVAGVPILAVYNLSIEAGTSEAVGGDNIAPFDLTLPDGRVLVKPGNLLGLSASLLWGSDPQYAAPGVQADFDGDGQQTLGEALPDAAVLKASLDTLDAYAGQLLGLARDWHPSTADAFTILATRLPTVGNYFSTWKTSPFVAGLAATQTQYRAVSRLADAREMLASLITVYSGVSPQVRAADPAQDHQIESGLSSLYDFVAGLTGKEQAGKRYTPEEADLLQTEAQDRATALTGQVAQSMAQLGVQIQQGTSACSGVAPAPTPSPTP